MNMVIKEPVNTTAFSVLAWVVLKPSLAALLGWYNSISRLLNILSVETVLQQRLGGRERDIQAIRILTCHKDYLWICFTDCSVSVRTLHEVSLY